ncbi:energy transducer TonB [Hanstruepera ponticola]|uniref:energy transducer TonB n=1 Tax=Hanstruepera ponticola TaxID=2042995 RepID=UPI000CF1B1F4|nr:hypothetical protein [Hanstruepera ponticola]
MKKRLIIFGLIAVTVSLAAYSFINRESKVLVKTTEVKKDLPDTSVSFADKKPLEFFFYVGSRFESIKKSEIENATSIYDFISAEDKKQIKKLHATELILVINDKRTHMREYGTEENLTSEQLKLLQSIDYSKHFVMKALYENYDSEHHDFNPHYTVVPETQASYEAGNKALLKYLKENKSKDSRFIDEKKLQAVKVSFTITKDGIMENVNLDRTTGYPQLDLELKELITNAPGNWIPAKNQDGNPVDQELVMSFGLADMC